MLRFGKIKIAKEEFYAAKKPIKIWDADNDDTVISKLLVMKHNSIFLTKQLFRCYDSNSFDIA